MRCNAASKRMSISFDYSVAPAVGRGEEYEGLTDIAASSSGPL